MTTETFHAQLAVSPLPRGTLLAASEKEHAYAEVEDALASLLDPAQSDVVAAMATCASLLHHALPYASWTGFYRVVGPALLRVGPYQGPVGCLEISFAHGVCGAAARERATQVVPDVDAFPGHIACDGATRSEIVVPAVVGERLLAVLDVDSRQAAAFDQIDAAGLGRIVALLIRRIS
jgi:GAF domain-containing protein